MNKDIVLYQPRVYDVPADLGILPEPYRRKRAFTASTIANLIALALFIAFSALHIPQEKQRPIEATNLTFPVPQPRVHHRIPRLVAPHLTPHLRPTPQPSQQVAAPATPQVNAPVMAARRSPSVPVRRVQVGTFANAAATPMVNLRAAPTPKVGAFGNPMGAKVNVAATASRYPAPVLGSFSGVPGAYGAGAGASPHAPGGTGGGNGSGGVRTGGFGTGMYAGGGGTGNRGSLGSQFEPVTVTYSAKPSYTSEARGSHVEGEVVLRVRFSADGQVQILGVVQPLGHGLDQAAENAVQQYRFRPALRDGRPVDQVTTVHVRFQLAA